MSFPHRLPRWFPLIHAFQSTYASYVIYWFIWEWIFLATVKWLMVYSGSGNSREASLRVWICYAEWSRWDEGEKWCVWRMKKMPPKGKEIEAPTLILLYHKEALNTQPHCRAKRFSCVWHQMTGFWSISFLCGPRKSDKQTNTGKTVFTFSHPFSLYSSVSSVQLCKWCIQRSTGHLRCPGTGFNSTASPWWWHREE